MEQILARFKFLPVIIIVNILIISNIYGQVKNRADERFEKIKKIYAEGQLGKAEKETLGLLVEYPAYVNGYMLLSEIYRDLDQKEKEYETLFKAKDLTNEALFHYRLGTVAYLTQHYESSLEAYLKYDSLITDSAKKNQVKRKIQTCRVASEAIKVPLKFNPLRLPDGVNTTDDEYWPVLSLDGKALIFTRLTKSNSYITNEDFYFSHLLDSGWSVAQPITEINTIYNEGAQSLSADGKLLFFSSCGKNDGLGSCDIYYSRFVNGKWEKPRNAGEPVNTSGWDSQPSFSSDYQYLYFSSDRKGGKGKKDIWRVGFKGFDSAGNIKWGKTENPGDSINTPGDEISPFIHAANQNLYFASDYLPGLGGFDLFVSKINGNNFSAPVNLGFPLNSSENEQGLFISADGNKAFFASARDKKFKHDIYWFEPDVKIKPVPATFVKVKVVDSETFMPLRAEISVHQREPEKQFSRTDSTDNEGIAFVSLPVGRRYSLNVAKPGYLFYSQSVDFENGSNLTEPVSLEIGLKSIKPGYTMDLYNIYFETDSFNILAGSEPELDKLFGFLDSNKSLTVEIQGHTDNSGNSDKNLILSEKRALSVFKYLVSKGISESRLVSKGYGETMPVADNSTLEGKQKNRRTTIKVINGKN